MTQDTFPTAETITQDLPYFYPSYPGRLWPAEYKDGRIDDLNLNIGYEALINPRTGEPVVTITDGCSGGDVRQIDRCAIRLHTGPEIQEGHFTYKNGLMAPRHISPAILNCWTVRTSLNILTTKGAPNAAIIIIPEPVLYPIRGQLHNTMIDAGLRGEFRHYPDWTRQLSPDPFRRMAGIAYDPNDQFTPLSIVGFHWIQLKALWDAEAKNKPEVSQFMKFGEYLDLEQLQQ